MECKVCKKTFTGVECMKQHEASKKHVYKLKLLQMFPLKDEKLPEKMKSFIYCSTCNVKFSKKEGFQNHAKSSEHIKMLTKDKTKKEIQKILMLNVEHSSTIPHSIFKCEFCNKCFTGVKPYDKHLQSAIHKRKSINSECKDDSNAVNSCRFCKICSKEFNGPVPYSLHLKSKLHREKEIELQKISKMELSDTTKKWYCEICKKQCTGYIPYEQHLSSKIHFRNLKENEIKVAPKSNQKQISEEESKINEGATTSADSASNDTINLDMNFLSSPMNGYEIGEPPSLNRFKTFLSEAKPSSCINEQKINPFKVPFPVKRPLSARKRGPLPEPEKDPLPKSKRGLLNSGNEHNSGIKQQKLYPFSVPLRGPLPESFPDKNPLPAHESGPLPAHEEVLSNTLHLKDLRFRGKLVRLPPGTPLQKGPLVEFLREEFNESTGVRKYLFNITYHHSAAEVDAYFAAHPDESYDALLRERSSSNSG